MSITKPAGHSLTVGELRDALADLDERTCVEVTLGVAGERVDLLCVERAGQEVEIAIGSVDPHPLVDLLAEIVAGEYTLKQAKAEAALVLRAAGYKVLA
jgi:hypothetical protein